jgi:hypothetical protein
MRKDPKTGLTDAEELSHTTLRIEVEYNDVETGIGTGFLYQFLSSNKIHIPALVANKHLLENARTVNLIFNPTGQDKKVDYKTGKIGFQIKDFLNSWYGHPNPNVDLAFIPMSNIIRMMKEKGENPFLVFLRRENFAKIEEWNELTALEQIIFVGYPDDVWDSVNNLPIFRRGITATHPKIDFRGLPIFLIDAAVYTGSSGSPVFLYEYKEIMMGEELNLGKDKPRLIGILYGSFAHQQEGVMKSIPIPTSKKKVPIMDIPNNLGIVIKATELDGFIPLIDSKLAEQRNTEKSN